MIRSNGFKSIPNISMQYVETRKHKTQSVFSACLSRIHRKMLSDVLSTSMRTAFNLPTVKFPFLKLSQSFAVWEFTTQQCKEQNQFTHSFQSNLIISNFLFLSPSKFYQSFFSHYITLPFNFLRILMSDENYYYR